MQVANYDDQKYLTLNTKNLISQDIKRKYNNHQLYIMMG